MNNFNFYDSSSMLCEKELPLLFISLLDKVQQFVFKNSSKKLLKNNLFQQRLLFSGYFKYNLAQRFCRSPFGKTCNVYKITVKIPHNVSFNEFTIVIVTQDKTGLKSVKN